MFKKLFCITICCLLLSVTSCKDDDDNIIKPAVTLNLLETAGLDADLTTFVKAMEKAGLTAVLTSETDATILAPTNEAFDILYGELDVVDLTEIPATTLKQILEYHIIPNMKLSTSAFSNGNGNGFVETTALAPGFENTPYTLYFDASSDVNLNGDTTIVNGSEDREATNGFIQPIGNVLSVPAVQTFITSNTNLSQFTTALFREDQKEILEFLQNPENTPYTILAPSNTAFDSLFSKQNKIIAEELMVEVALIPADQRVSITSIDSLSLSNILNYHILPKSNLRSDQFVDGEVDTRFGILKTRASLPSIIDNQGTEVPLVLRNGQAENGVLHTIDSILQPQ